MNKSNNTSHFTEVKRQMVIEGSEHSSHLSSLLQTLGNNVPIEFQQFLIRNNEFKQRMLTSNGTEV